MSDVLAKGGLIDVCDTVAELDTLVELAKRAAIREQDFQGASFFQDVQKRARRARLLDYSALLSDYPEIMNGLERPPIRYAV